MPHIKTGNNGHAVSTCLIVQEARGKTHHFFDDACYLFYLRRLFHCLNYFQVKLHAYALLPDSIWLLLTPHTRLGASKLVANVNRDYIEYFSARFARHSKPWPRTLRQFPVTAGDAVLVCQKLVESAPVKSGRVQHAGAWHWSSYCDNAFGSNHRFLSRHRAIAGYLSQMSDPGSHYRSYIAAEFDRGHYEYLRQRINRNKPLPDARREAPHRQVLVEPLQ